MVDEYACQVCDDTFSSPQSRGGHLGSHTEEEKKEAIREEILRLDSVTDGTPRQKDMANHGEFAPATVARLFGSWGSAVSDVGLDPNPAAYDEIPDDDLIQDIRALAEELGRPPLGTEVDELGKFSTVPYRRFGTWDEVLQKAGLEPVDRKDISNEDLIDEIQRLSEDIGHPPTRSEMTEHGQYSPSPYIDRFGGWNASLRTAGLEVNTRSKISRKETLEEFRRVGGLVSHIPRRRDVEEHSEFSIGPFEDKFDSWPDLREEAGFPREIEHDSDWTSDGVLLDDLAELGDELGRPPTAKDMREQGPRQPTDYTARFGSWLNALNDAGFQTDFIDQLKRGEEHPNWEPDTTDRYGSGWTVKKKREVRKRDGYECQVCGLSQQEHLEKLGARLNVHHIIPARKFDDAEARNSPDNLVTLCRSCHSKWEGIPLRPQRAD